MRVAPLALAAAVVLAAPAALAATYQVGPSRTHKTLSAVSSLLNPGDVVEVDGNATYPAVNFTRNGSAASKITIRGVRVAGKRPVISGGTNSIEAAGDHYVFEGLEITGGSSRCFFHHAHDVTLRDSVVHDCPKQGILGADNDSGSLLLEYTEVYKCGGGTFDHQIYMATDESTHPGAVFRMQFCYVHDSNGGNSVKSRAERNEIYYNWIEGGTFHELELIGPDPAGGVAESLKREDSDVVGNVLKKTLATGWFVRFGGDGTGQSRGRYRVVNNTFITSAETTTFRLFDALESVEVHNNVFYRIGGGPLRIIRDTEANWVSGRRIAGSNNWVMSGSTFVPMEWTGTITGADPGFTNVAMNDVTPNATSALLNAGAASTSGPPGSAFPAPLATPAFHPPMRVLLAPGAAAARAPVGAIDIGAFERGTAPADAGPMDSGADSAIIDSATLDSATLDSAADTTVASDSESPIDSETPVTTDSALASDSALADGAQPGEPNADTASDGSCGCRTAGSSSSFGAWPLLGLLLLVRRRAR